MWEKIQSSALFSQYDSSTYLWNGFIHEHMIIVKSKISISWNKFCMRRTLWILCEHPDSPPAIPTWCTCLRINHMACHGWQGKEGADGGRMHMKTKDLTRSCSITITSSNAKATAKPHPKVQHSQIFSLPPASATQPLP